MTHMRYPGGSKWKKIGLIKDSGPKYVIKEPYKSIIEQEGDFYQWDRESLRCKIWRHPLMKTWNGYVGVPDTHRCYRMHKHDSVLDGIEVHGGLTFSGFFDNRPIGGLRVDPEGPRQYWYLGFDTAHAFDIIPSFLSMLPEESQEPDGLFPGSTYKDKDYVMSETNKLAEQLQ